MPDPRDEYTGSHPITPYEAPPELRAICMAFPNATEKWAWGSPTWRINDRLFAQFSASADALDVWVPAPEGAQEMLMTAKPARFFRPKYVGHQGWVGIHLKDDAVDWDEVAGIIADGYQMSLEKTTKKPRKKSV